MANQTPKPPKNFYKPTTEQINALKRLAREKLRSIGSLPNGPSAFDLAVDEILHEADPKVLMYHGAYQIMLSVRGSLRHDLMRGYVTTPPHNMQPFPRDPGRGTDQGRSRAPTPPTRPDDASRLSAVHGPELLEFLPMYTWPVPGTTKSLGEATRPDLEQSLKHLVERNRTLERRMRVNDVAVRLVENLIKRMDPARERERVCDLPNDVTRTTQAEWEAMQAAWRGQDA